MSVTDAMAARNSTRAFKKTAITDDDVFALLDVARLAPSWSNTQPYRVAVATGARCDALRDKLSTVAAEEMPQPDHNILFQYPPELNARRKSTGHGLYKHIGVENDTGARGALFARNFAFFDAPAVVFLYAHADLGVYGVLDAGLFLQSLLLTATERGFQTCTQGALASFPHVLSTFFSIPDGYKLLCGVSVGHAADDTINGYRPQRRSVDELLVAPI
jgi:nitroreductase